MWMRWCRVKDLDVDSMKEDLERRSHRVHIDCIGLDYMRIVVEDPFRICSSRLGDEVT